MTPTGGWTWPHARVVEVHDADTIKLDVDVGWDMHAYKWIRLLDVHAPELREPTGLKARQDTYDWLAAHAPGALVEVTTYRVTTPLEIRFKTSFTRYIGQITAKDGNNLNQHLIGLGYTDQGM